MIVEIFKVGSTKGLKGHVKIHSVARKSLTYSHSLNWLLKSPNSTIWIRVEIEELSDKYAKFTHVNSWNEAQAMTHSILGIRYDDLPPLGKEEHYVCSLIGKDIINQQNEKLGSVQDVLSMPSNDVIVFSVNGKSHFIPFISDYVKSVDKVITVNWSLDESWYY